MRRLVILVAFFISIHVSSQELNCTLVVNAQQTGNENVQVFKTLEKQLKKRKEVYKTLSVEILNLEGKNVKAFNFSSNEKMIELPIKEIENGL